MACKTPTRNARTVIVVFPRENAMTHLVFRLISHGVARIVHITTQVRVPVMCFDTMN